MKICIISTYPPRECGIGIYTSNLVEALFKSGIEVEVITFKGYDYKMAYVKPLLKNSSLLSYFKAINYIRKNDFDKVLIQHEYIFYNVFYFPIFLFLLRLLKKDVNITMHTIPSYSGFFKKNIFRILNTVILLFASQIILHTNYAREKLIKNTWLIKPIKILPIPIKSKNEELGKIIKKKKANLLCFGFIGDNKGQDIACKALGGMANIQLNIVGSVHPKFIRKQTPYFEKVKAYSANYPNIKLGNTFIPESKKASIFIENDFILLPYRYIEQSAVLTEAWSFYKIPICSDIPAFKEEIKDNKYGVLFRSEDPGDLKGSVLNLIKDVSEQRRILRNIITLNKERSFDEVVRKYAGELV